MFYCVCLFVLSFVVFSDYSCFCIQELVLVMLRGPHGMLGIKVFALPAMQSKHSMLCPISGPRKLSNVSSHYFPYYRLYDTFRAPS